VIISYKDKATKDIHYGKDTSKARKTCPKNIWSIAIRKLNMIRAATKIEDLKSPPSNHLEKLKDDRKGQYSIRINDQYRICFEWTGTDAQNVEVTDYH
jgi:toxin HigB-1